VILRGLTAVSYEQKRKKKIKREKKTKQKKKTRAWSLHAGLPSVGAELPFPRLCNAQLQYTCD